MKTLLRSQSGMSMLNLIILLMLVGVVTAAGAKMLGPLVQRGKINETKTTINSAVDAIISWSLSRGHLPGTTAEFAEASSNQYDAWGRRLRYLYDKNLTVAPSSNAICNYTSTGLTVNGSANIAFAVLSLGDDYTAQSSWKNAAIDSDDAKYLYPLHDGLNGAVNNAMLTSPDLYRLVTLDELKARVGCFGQTGGRLRIVNNELPSACSGASYSATLYGDGGVPAYTWATTTTGWTIDASGKLSRSSAPVAGETLSVTLTDSKGTTIQRSYGLKVDTCGSPPGTPNTPIVFNPPTPGVVTDNWNGGTPEDQGTNNTDAPSGKFNMTVVDGTLSAISVRNGTTASCIWFQRPLTLTGKKLRAYYQFAYQEGTGFTFALVPALGRTTISSCDENARTGFGTGIPGNPIIGAEFLVNDVNDGVGPGSTCIALNQNVCTATGSGIDNWATGSTIYYVRIELDATETTNPAYKIWMTSNATHKTVLKDLSTAYTGSLTPITRTLTAANLTGLSSFFLGFTTGQHGNDRVNMTVADLKFELH
ncbi:hypothetical protein [Trichlorobacter ammonificans]|uniref:Uncharacterized protein n=1 Tax=Trichlorobacter ammonificans TaxID=2916410 RepID=A0ABM9D5G0_9BACT|nr:hypothetical protein [Trichlorobacter ammonificans]CAH2030470.1 protein of unknown function [Trichlorobacter ammonificans]